jgi:long-subunit fatty acid transport protein
VASGNARNSTDHFLTLGDEYRFSPNTIGIVSAGAQFHSIEGGESSVVPYLELSGNTKVNKQLSFKTFIRYRAESDGLTRQSKNGETFNYSKRETLRLGVTNQYQISPKFFLSGGLDYIPGSYTGASQKSSDKQESLLNIFISATLKFNDFLTGVATYTFADNVSDFDDDTYRRNRISLGLNASF